MELQKKDFLIQKEKEFKNDIFGVEDLKNENNNSFDKSKEKEIQRKQCRYRFKKKINH
jgi:hypothetical protein